MDFDFPQTAVYIFSVGVAIEVEHALFSNLPEVARRAMGIATVLIISALFAYFGLMDMQTVIVLTFGFLAAATVLGFNLAHEQRRVLAVRRKMLERNERETETNRKS